MGSATFVAFCIYKMLICENYFKITNAVIYAWPWLAGSHLFPLKAGKSRQTEAEGFPSPRPSLCSFEPSLAVPPCQICFTFFEK